jgi:hypothetical protein
LRRGSAAGSQNEKPIRRESELFAWSIQRLVDGMGFTLGLEQYWHNTCFRFAGGRNLDLDLELTLLPSNHRSHSAKLLCLNELPVPPIKICMDENCEERQSLKR